MESWSRWTIQVKIENAIITIHKAYHTVCDIQQCTYDKSYTWAASILSPTFQFIYHQGLKFIVYKLGILPAITALSPEQWTLIHYLGGFFCVSLPGPWFPGIGWDVPVYIKSKCTNYLNALDSILPSVGARHLGVMCSDIFWLAWHWYVLVYNYTSRGERNNHIIMHWITYLLQSVAIFCLESRLHLTGHRS